MQNYEELYPPRRWEDPVSYVRSSETADECCDNALANGFTYYMDERDEEWLQKNNEESRGEGTSAQGAVSGVGTTTRSGPTRSAKAKGKEPDIAQPMTISEDEFEVVMGVFEKVTHEKTEFLHHVCPFQTSVLRFADWGFRALKQACHFLLSRSIKTLSRRH